VLYTPQATVGYTALTDDLTFAPGYEEALHYNLALRLCRPYGRPIDPDLKEMADTTLSRIKSANVRLDDRQVATPWTVAVYDINVDGPDEELGLLRAVVYGLLSAASAEETINLFPETLKQTTTRSPDQPDQRAGQAQLCDPLGHRPECSIYEQDGRCFTVAGPFFDEIKADGTTTAWGTLNAGGTRPVTMVGNGGRGNQILISTSGRARCSTPAPTPSTAITHASFPADVITVGFIDGYGIAVTPDRFTLSALFDMTTWSGGTGQRSGRRAGRSGRSAITSCCGCSASSRPKSGTTPARRVSRLRRCRRCSSNAASRPAMRSRRSAMP
jgi:hypothetical protein